MTHEKETLPFINEFTRVIEFGKAYSADKNLKLSGYNTKYD